MTIILYPKTVILLSREPYNIGLNACLMMQICLRYGFILSGIYLLQTL